MKRYLPFAGWAVNTFFFYFGWILLAKQAASGDPALAILLVAGIVALHLVFVKNLRAEIIIIACLAIAGTMIDTLFSVGRIIDYHSGYTAIPYLAPPWITAMWVLFATTINHAFEWLHRRPVLASLLGACGGPFTYLAAMKLGAAHFLVHPMTGILLLSALWALLFPAILKFSVWVQEEP